MIIIFNSYEIIDLYEWYLCFIFDLIYDLDVWGCYFRVNTVMFMKKESMVM